MTAIMEIQWRRSFASPLCFHAGQLFPYQAQIRRLPSKMLDLGLDACQNAIDPLDRDREPDRLSGKCLPAFLTVHHAHRCLGKTGYVVVLWFYH